MSVIIVAHGAADLLGGKRFVGSENGRESLLGRRIDAPWLPSSVPSTAAAIADLTQIVAAQRSLAYEATPSARC